MKIRFCLVLAMWGTWLTIAAFANTDIPQTRPALSPQAEISVITQWPGSEIYLAWGHSALRVRDPGNGIDLIYNYGTFDVEDPMFIAYFVRGELNYFLSEYPFQLYFNYDQRTEDRIWEEQVLNLTQDQKNRLYQFLAWNAQPKNAVYRYDFILDNCSTRIRDALERILGPDLRFREAGVAGAADSFRAGINSGVAQRPFYQFMFYLVVGSAADRPTTLREATWRPHELEDILGQAQISHDGTSQPLIKVTQRFYQPPLIHNYDTPWWNPAFVLWPLAIAVLWFAIRKIARIRKHREDQPSPLVLRMADALLFGIIGILGCIIFYLVVFSDHSAVKGNFNLVWMWPTHLVAAVFVGRKRIPVWLAAYLGLAALSACLPLLLWPIWPQALASTMIPLLLIIFVRAAVIAARGWHFRIRN